MILFLNLRGVSFVVQCCERASMDTSRIHQTFCLKQQPLPPLFRGQYYYDRSPEHFQIIQEVLDKGWWFWSAGIEASELYADLHFWGVPMETIRFDEGGNLSEERMAVKALIQAMVSDKKASLTLFVGQDPVLVETHAYERSPRRLPELLRHEVDVVRSLALLHGFDMQVVKKNKADESPVHEVVLYHPTDFEFTILSTLNIRSSCRLLDFGDGMIFTIKDGVFCFPEIIKRSWPSGIGVLLEKENGDYVMDCTYDGQDAEDLTIIDVDVPLCAFLYETTDKMQGQPFRPYACDQGDFDPEGPFVTVFLRRVLLVTGDA